jgi:hypothetical protein|tara:strand:+ start:303 stop:458 length:156 start_codon:yes stop_codon:yes gene_type:complete
MINLDWVIANKEEIIKKYGEDSYTYVHSRLMLEAIKPFHKKMDKIIKGEEK